MCDRDFTSASQKRPGGSSFHWSQRLGHHRSPCFQKPLWLIPRIPFYIKPSATRPETDTLGEEERSSVPSPVFERASFERQFKDPKDHQPLSEQAPSFYEWTAHLIWGSEAGIPFRMWGVWACTWVRSLLLIHWRVIFSKWYPHIYIHTGSPTHPSSETESQHTHPLDGSKPC